MARKSKEDTEKTRLAIIDAARRVFLRSGVARSTFEEIAAEAGVTRGAVYYHFQDKETLFFAIREDILAWLEAPVDDVLFSPAYADPLDAVEAALLHFFRQLRDHPAVLDTFDIMMMRCEYVGAFAGVHEEVFRPGRELLGKLGQVYARAAQAGTLRPGLAPEAAAWDTWAFADGLLHLIVGQSEPGLLDQRAPAMVRAHVALRRAA